MNDLPLVKAHAYGNDFLYVRERDLGDVDPVPVARRLCERHRGAGADGLIVYGPTPEGARMRLINADGSAAELSGNGLRALAAIVIRDRGNPSQVVPGAEVTVETAAGPRFLTLVARDDPRFMFRAWMGEPSDVRQETVHAAGESLLVSTFAIGNPQCVVLGELPGDDRFARIGPALERHARFPEGTNVEFAHVVAPDRRPLERVLGPELGDFIRGLHEQHGVVFHLGKKASSHMRGGVVLEGGERLEADVLVAGIGVRPATALAEQAGLRVDNGIVVDACLETATGGIFAVGDAARWPDPRGGGLVRIEHWVVAQRQGQAVARSIVGERTPFTDVPFFWSQHYDIAINYTGHAQSWDSVRVDGSVAAFDCAVTYMRGGRRLAVATISRDLESLRAEAEMEREIRKL